MSTAATEGERCGTWGTLWLLFQACLGDAQLPSHRDSLVFVMSGVLPLAALPSPSVKIISRVGGAKDEHGAVWHHRFARLTLFLLPLLLLHFFLILFGLGLL